MQQSLVTVEVAPIARALQEHLETVCQNELDRIHRRQVNFRSEQQDAIEDLTRGIVSRILHGMVTALEAASTEEESAALLGMIHRLFNLGERLTVGLPEELFLRSDERPPAAGERNHCASGTCQRRLKADASSPLKVHGVAKVPARSAPDIGEHNDEPLIEVVFRPTE